MTTNPDYMPTDSEERAYIRSLVGPEGMKRGMEPSDARISAQLGCAYEQVTKLYAMAQELQERISPILIPEDVLPISSEVDSPERQVGSEISNTLEDLNGQISRVQRRLGIIMQRVQL